MHIYLSIYLSIYIYIYVYMCKHLYISGIYTGGGWVQCGLRLGEGADADKSVGLG